MKITVNTTIEINLSEAPMLGTNPFDFVAPVFTLDMNKIVESARYLQNEIANNN